MSAPAAPGRVAALAFAAAFLVLIANGRPIGSGDTTATERTAAALAERGSVVLSETREEDPFTRAVPGGRLSIYPALTALIATPIFLLYGLLFDLTAAGLQIAGKLSAALLSATAVAVLARSYLRRVSPPRALVSALLFGLGTSVYSTSQALWQHPVVILFMVVAIDALARLESAPAGERRRLGLTAAVGLSLAAAARPAAIPISAVLFLYLLFRVRSAVVPLLRAAAIPAVLVGAYNAAFFGAPWRFGAETGGRFFSALPESLAGLLISPARGLLVFTPVALIAFLGLARAARGQVLARGLLAAVFTHFVFVAAWNEWHGGESFGPRLLTDMLPALFFYLPEALSAFPVSGATLGLASLCVQFLGGWTYDYRWERLHQRGRSFDEALWSWRDSPIPFALREGVLIQGVPDRGGRRLRMRSSRWVPFGPKGAVVDVSPEGLRVGGPPLILDIRLERGARVEASGISLIHPGDALAFRSVSAGDRLVRLAGSLEGMLGLETADASTTVPLSGPFDLTLPLRVDAGEEVYVRAASGALTLVRVEVSLATGVATASTYFGERRSGASPHLSFVRRTSK